MANPVKDLISGINALQDSLNINLPINQRTDNNGFLLPPTLAADASGLPASKVPNYRDGKIRRNIISWFVPQFGIIRMFVNPNSISYSKRKLISKDRTKGGYTLQYWGEELETLSISGTTGSSGIEGINVLEEIYRAEQYAFDTAGLSLIANASMSQNDNFLNAGSAEDAISSLISNLFGIDSLSGNIATVQEIPSLAELAFTVEMYYDGWVYRGFFENMTVTERADNFLLDYQISFTATQRRGYRTNYFPWHKSATNGFSDYNCPHSFSSKVNV